MAAQELQARLASMDATGVDQAILIPGHGYIRPDGMAEVFTKDLGRTRGEIVGFQTVQVEGFHHP